jgi:protein tyrosine phosphatase (PTP) superfamily phosphohydrolase (DUF442 family)
MTSRFTKIVTITTFLICVFVAHHACPIWRLKFTFNPLEPITDIIKLKNKICENFHTVEAGKFYRSAQLPQKKFKKYILKHGIKTVINLRGEHPEAEWWRTEKQICDQLGVQFFSLSFSAATLSSKENLRKLLDIYDTAPYPILVHCFGGADRTGEAASLWCLEKMGHNNKEASHQLAFIYGHIAWPAKDFLIKIWGGRSWFEKDYDPAQYPQFKQPK